MNTLKTLIGAAAFAVALAGTAQAEDYRAGDLVIENPHARATPPGAPVAGGYVTIRNTGSEPDRLVAVSADFSGRSEIHEMKMDGGVMKMRPLPDGLEIPAGGEVKLERGGNHLMFMKLEVQLKEGETRKVTLRFERVGDVEVVFAVVPIGGHKARKTDGMKHDGHGEKAKRSH